MNKTMYGLKLYIPFEDLSTYIHDHVEERYKDHTFIPVKVEVNELNCDIEISLVSANPIESDGLRYQLDLSSLPNNDKPPRGLRANTMVLDEAADISDNDIIEVAYANGLNIELPLKDSTYAWNTDNDYEVKNYPKKENNNETI